MAKKSKQKHKGLSYHKKKAWEEFSKYIRLRDWKRDGEIYVGEVKAALCITCGKLYPIEGRRTMQAGHFIPGRKGVVLFEEKQVSAQCYNCNHVLKGNWPAYFEVMVKRYGLKEVKKMITDSKKTKKYTIPELVELKKEFTNKLEMLK